MTSRNEAEFLRYEEKGFLNSLSNDQDWSKWKHLQTTEWMCLKTESFCMGWRVFTKYFEKRRKFLLPACSPSPDFFFSFWKSPISKLFSSRDCVVLKSLPNGKIFDSTKFCCRQKLNLAWIKNFVFDIIWKNCGKGRKNCCQKTSISVLSKIGIVW